MKIRRADDVAWRRIDRETVLVHLSRHRMYAINEPGADLWETMADPVEGDLLTELLADPRTAAFLADLVSEGLVLSEVPFPEQSAAAPRQTDSDPPPPLIEWREEIQRFAGNCGLLPGGGGLCTLQPQNS